VHASLLGNSLWMADLTLDLAFSGARSGSSRLCCHDCGEFPE
jgi:hypothetical protein